MKREKILLKGCRVITPGKPLQKGVNIEITDGVISDISEKSSSKGHVIDCSRKYVIPGFVNAHAHCYQNVMRGLGSDLHFINWLTSAKYPICEIMDEKDIYISTIIAHLEMMRSGITAVIDNFDFKNDLNGVRTLAQACRDSGIRAVIARGMRMRTEIAERWKVPDWLIPNDEKTEINISDQVIREFDGKLEGRLRISLSPTALYYSTKVLLRKCKELSEKYGVNLHIHVAEGENSQKACIELFGKREVELLDELGLLDRRFQAVHAIDLSREEIELISQRGSTVIHNPTSNMYLASGVAPVSELVRKQVKVALGTDGAASNDSYNFFETMKMTSLLQKVVLRDPQAISAEQVFEMATLNGAEILSDERIGRVEPGCRADLAVIDLNKVSTLPDYRPLNNIVYSGSPVNVEHVIIDGVPVIVDREFVSIDEHDSIEAFKETMEKIESKIESR